MKTEHTLLLQFFLMSESAFSYVVVVVVAVVLFFGGEGWSNTRWTVIPFSGGGVQQQNTHGRFMLLVLGLAVGIRISHMY